MGSDGAHTSLSDVSFERICMNGVGEAVESGEGSVNRDIDGPSAQELQPTEPEETAERVVREPSGGTSDETPRESSVGVEATEPSEAGAQTVVGDPEPHDTQVTAEGFVDGDHIIVCETVVLPQQSASTLDSVQAVNKENSSSDTAASRLEPSSRGEVGHTTETEAQVTDQTWTVDTHCLSETRALDSSQDIVPPATVDIGPTSGEGALSGYLGRGLAECSAETSGSEQLSVAEVEVADTPDVQPNTEDAATTRRGSLLPETATGDRSSTPAVPAKQLATTDACGNSDSSVTGQNRSRHASEAAVRNVQSDPDVGRVRHCSARDRDVPVMSESEDLVGVVVSVPSSAEVGTQKQPSTLNHADASKTSKRPTISPSKLVLTFEHLEKFRDKCKKSENLTELRRAAHPAENSNPVSDDREEPVQLNPPVPSQTAGCDGNAATGTNVVGIRSKDDGNGLLLTPPPPPQAPAAASVAPHGTAGVQNATVRRETETATSADLSNSQVTNNVGVTPGGPPPLTWNALTLEQQQKLKEARLIGFRWLHSYRSLMRQDDVQAAFADLTQWRIASFRKYYQKYNWIIASVVNQHRANLSASGSSQTQSLRPASHPLVNGGGMPNFQHPQPESHQLQHQPLQQPPQPQSGQLVRHLSQQLRQSLPYPQPQHHHQHLSQSPQLRHQQQHLLPSQQVLYPPQQQQLHHLPQQQPHQLQQPQRHLQLHSAGQHVQLNGLLHTRQQLQIQQQHLQQPQMIRQQQTNGLTNQVSQVSRPPHVVVVRAPARQSTSLPNHTRQPRLAFVPGVPGSISRHPQEIRLLRPQQPPLREGNSNQQDNPETTLWNPNLRAIADLTRITPVMNSRVMNQAQVERPAPNADEEIVQRRAIDEQRAEDAVASHDPRGVQPIVIEPTSDTLPSPPCQVVSHYQALALLLFCRVFGTWPMSSCQLCLPSPTTTHGLPFTSRVDLYCYQPR